MQVKHFVKTVSETRGFKADLPLPFEMLYLK